MIARAETEARPGLAHYLYLERNALHRELAAAIARLPGDDLCVLDLGCGQKRYDALFADKAARIFGLEPARTPYADLVARAERLPFRDASLDVVLCTQVFQYLDDPFAAAREIHRVLRAGGLALVSAPSTYPLYDPPRPRWRFMPDGLRALFKDFDEVEIKPLGGFIACYAQTLNLFLKNLVFGRRPWENWATKRLMWWLVFPLVNLAGKALDALFYNPRAAIGHLVTARK